MYPELELYIGGEWLQAVLNPATEQSITNLWHATNADFECALAAAQRAFPTWRKVAPYDRAHVLRKSADILRSRRDDIARASMFRRTSKMFGTVLA